LQDPKRFSTQNRQVYLPFGAKQANGLKIRKSFPLGIFCDPLTIVISKWVSGHDAKHLAPEKMKR
jgi:hypothetical protein